jgi:hypothetical protein
MGVIFFSMGRINILPNFSTSFSHGPITFHLRKISKDDSDAERREYEYCTEHTYDTPNTVAARSMALTIFARSTTGNMGSNPIRGMDA